MIDFHDINKVLILAPHPDDAEFSSGGTIDKLLSEGKEIFYAVFSMCEKSIPAGFPPKAIELELHEAVACMGIKEDHLIKYDYEVREFPKYRQEILEDMIKLNRQLKPDLVFLPSKFDMHQDHKTIHEEGLRAFKYCNLLGYEMPWNNFTFSSSIYVVLDKEAIEKKMEVINQYVSQQNRNYSSKEFVESLAKLRGIQIQESFAESFEVIRWIMR